MSIKALNWAAKQSRELNSTSKFVLTTLADYANEENCAYPSQETLSSRTLLDPKTVTIALERLVRHGFIQDTGERKGRTGRVKVYQLNVLITPILDGLNPPENGAVDLPNPTSNPPKNGVSESPQKRIAEPSLGTLEPKKRNQLSKFIDFLVEDPRFDGLDVEAEVARAVEWYKKKNRPVTERLLENWLLHAEQPLEEDEEEVGSLAGDDYFSWDGWTEERRRALLELWPKAAEPPVRWDKISRPVKEQIEARVKEGWS
jgi:DNA-binding MarR family transcriptional regulator